MRKNMQKLQPRTRKRFSGCINISTVLIKKICRSCFQKSTFTGAAPQKGRKEKLPWQ